MGGDRREGNLSQSLDAVVCAVMQCCEGRQHEFHIGLIWQITVLWHWTECPPGLDIVVKSLSVCPVVYL